MSHRNQRWDLGQGLVEYALLLALIALAVLIALGTMGVELKEYYDYALTELRNAR